MWRRRRKKTEKIACLYNIKKSSWVLSKETDRGTERKSKNNKTRWVVGDFKLAKVKPVCHIYKPRSVSVCVWNDLRKWKEKSWKISIFLFLIYTLPTIKFFRSKIIFPKIALPSICSSITALLKHWQSRIQDTNISCFPPSYNITASNFLFGCKRWDVVESTRI